MKMSPRSSSFRRYAIAAVLVAGTAAIPANAYLFWTRPALGGVPVTGDEKGLALALPGATAPEKKANLIWTLRAGLNVAALQCQFAPQLRTVANYNNMLRQHAGELQTTYTTLSGYFRRTGGKTWQNALDQYTTRTYNSFSTLYAQLTFCEAAASIGRETLERPRGELGEVASTRLVEFRNSLKPVGDAAFSSGSGTIMLDPAGVGETPACVDRKGRPSKKC